MSRRRLKAAVLVVALAASLALAAQPASSQSDGRRISGLALASPEPGVITATWDVPADAPAKYRLRYGPEGGDWRKKTVNAAEARLSGLEPGTSYRVQVRGRYSSSDWGPWSAEATIQARTDPSPDGDGGRSDRVGDSDKVDKGDVVPPSGPDKDGGDRLARQSDAEAPEVEAAFVEGTVLRLVFDDDLDDDHVPAESAFEVTKGASGTEVTVSAVAVSGDLVTLTLGAAITSSDTDVEVDYDAPTTDPLQNEDGDGVDGFDDQAVSVASSLMSNLGQTNTDSTAGTNEFLQFNTGAMGGYLTSVTLDYRGQVLGSASDQGWRVHSDEGCSSTNRVVTLQRPSLSSTGNKVFAVPPGEVVRLRNNTTYRLCHTNNNDASVATWGSTEGTGLDSGGQPGWGIGDDSNEPYFRVQVSGVAADLELPSDNNDLVSLTVSDGTDDVALVPPFGSNTGFVCEDCYVVSVGVDVEQVTVTAVAEDDMATVAIVDDNGDRVFDASTDPGFQVNVAVGATSLNLPVTAESGATDGSVFLTVYRGSRETVSNLDRPATASSATLRNWAVPFTAGEDSTLHSVTVDYRGLQAGFVAGELSLAIHEKHASEDRPGQHLADLEKYSDSLSVGDAEFPVAGGDTLELTAGTTYYFVVGNECAGCTGGYRLGVTDADGERGLSGWSLGDVLLEHDGTSWTADADGRTIAFAVNATTSYTEDPPDFADADLVLSRSVAENTPAGQNVGAAAPAATDPDGDTVTYMLDGADAAGFGFDDATRQISTKAALDHETQEQHALLVTASDPDGNFDQADVTVTVTDNNEPATLTIGPAGAPRVGTELTATLDDPDDGTTVRLWRWQRSDTEVGTRTDIPGTNSPTYTPSDDDLGKWLWTDVNYTDTHGNWFVRARAEAVVAERAAGPCAAESCRVSNLGVRPWCCRADTSRWFQGFRTGSLDTYWRFESVDLEINYRRGPVTVEVWDSKLREGVSHAEVRSRAPGRMLGVLENPGDLDTPGIKTFSAPTGKPILLQPDKDYFVRVYTPGRFNIVYTNEFAEDQDSSTGWSIANSHYAKAEPNPTTYAFSLQMRINASVTERGFTAPAPVEGGIDCPNGWKHRESTHCVVRVGEPAQGYIADTVIPRPARQAMTTVSGCKSAHKSHGSVDDNSDYEKVGDYADIWRVELEGGVRYRIQLFGLDLIDGQTFDDSLPSPGLVLYREGNQRTVLLRNYGIGRLGDLTSRSNQFEYTVPERRGGVYSILAMRNNSRGSIISDDRRCGDGLLGGTYTLLVTEVS